MKSISGIFNSYLLKNFLVVSVVIITIGLLASYHYKKQAYKQIIIEDTYVLNSVALSHFSENITARDMYLYEHGEEKGLDSVAFKNRLAKLSSCEKLGLITQCEDNDKLIIFQPIYFNSTKLGYIEYKAPIKKNINQSVLYIILLILFINLLITILGVTIFVKKPMEKDLTRLLAYLGQREIDSQDIKIEEYNLIYRKYSQKKKELEKAEDEKLQSSLFEFQYKLNKQVAHDIRSPLEALRSVLENISGLDYLSKEILEKSIVRISDIANGLLETRKMTGYKEKFNLAALINDILTDKKLEHSIDISLRHSKELYGLFLSGSENNLYRAFSNLINNAVESSKKEKLNIIFSIEIKNRTVDICIGDNGIGMTMDTVQKILNGGHTTKKGGNGLGVQFAKNIVESMNGTFNINSVLGEGTLIELSIPLIDTPTCFVDLISIPKDITLLTVIDDDISFLELYKNKFINYKVQQCTSINNIVNASDNTYYFIDYDLGDGDTGVEYILANRIQDKAYLVTSMYKDSVVQAKCLKNNIKLIPKQIFFNLEIVST